MEHIALIGTVMLIHLLAVASPGPDFIMAVKNSLSYSRRAGIWTALGFSLGISVHIFYCLAGLALVISQSILMFNFIKLIGAAYLIYIGYQSWKAKGSKVEINATKTDENISALKAVRMGFLTNVLNPKATLFFLSLFTLVISPDTPLSIMVIMSILMIAQTFAWFSLVAVLFTHSKVRSVFLKFERLFNKIFGGLLIALGVKVAVSD